MPEMLKILLLEDSPADAELVSRELNRANLRHEMRRVDTRDDFLRGLKEYAPDIILSDHTMPGYDGTAALRDARELKPTIPFVYVSGTLGEDKAVESLKHGATDYVIKGDLHRLPSSIERALEEKRLRRERETAIQQLRASESQFRYLAEHAPVGIMLADAKGRPTFCNEHWSRITGYSIAESLTMNYIEAYHPDDRQRVIAELDRMRKTNQPCVIDYRQVRPSGEIRWVTNSSVCELDHDGKRLGYIGLLIDHTEHTLAEQKVRRLSRIHEVLSGINSTIVRVSDREKLFADVCHIAVHKGNFIQAWITLVDSDSHEIRYTKALGRNPKLLGASLSFPAKTIEEISPFGAQAYMTGQPVILDKFEPPQVDAYWIDMLHEAGIRSAVHLPLISGKQTFGVFALLADSADFFNEDEMRLLNELAEDIAFALDHLAKEERLKHLAYYDSLTELPNRALFLDLLQQQLSDVDENQKIAVMAFDIERFRHINESFGEHSGDALLKMVANRLASYVIPGLVGRLGGNSFGAILPRSDNAEKLAHLIDRNQKKWLTAPFEIAGQEIVVPLKVGIAMYPDNGKDADTLFQNANAALRQAKTSHERFVFYSEKINARTTELLHFETRLRNAVEQEQFVLYYQPKINLETGRIGSVEALMRWKDPERGLVPPGEFIPLLEETGLIYDMGMWALQRAFDDHAKLRALFPRFAPYIAVNVSALQLQRKSFYEDVLQVISQAGDGHHGLDIEITESLIMHDIEDNIRKLREVRNHDVHIAVDDFGTGYSSLAYIAKLPIDVLKIDRSFVVKMAESADDLSIVSAIITLAHSLDLRVVAEGVETEAQADMLRKLKCDEAQGYLFCRPIPFEELVGRLTMDADMVVLKPA